MMERVVRDIAAESTRSFGSVRLGTVWGASGSVLTRWQESAKRDGRIDVTDPEMTRFILTGPEAIGRLVARFPGLRAAGRPVRARRARFRAVSSFPVAV